MSDEDRFTFGKHKQKTFADVRRDDPGYVNWVLGLDNPSAALGKFASYCKAKDAAAGTPRKEFICAVHNCKMRGPITVKNGESHNIGRQFYSCRYNGPRGEESRKQDGVEDCGLDGFKWADGSDPFSANSCRRAEKHHGVEHDSIGVGVSTPHGQYVADEVRRGPAGYQDPRRGGMAVNPVKRRQPDFDAADQPGPRKAARSSTAGSSTADASNGSTGGRPPMTSKHPSWTCAKHGHRLLGPYPAADAEHFSIMMFPPQDFYRCPLQGQDGCTNQGGLRMANGFGRM